MQYPYQFDEPWQVHPDIDTPINDLDEEKEPEFDWDEIK